jgi:hypothetical protein
MALSRVAAGFILGRRLPVVIRFLVKELPNEFAQVRIAAFGQLLELDLLFGAHHHADQFFPLEAHFCPAFLASLEHGRETTLWPYRCQEVFWAANLWKSGRFCGYRGSPSGEPWYKACHGHVTTERDPERGTREHWQGPVDNRDAPALRGIRVR